jgi:serine/threonine protein kinase/Flp pilus assembly protein TadD
MKQVPPPGNHAGALKEDPMQASVKQPPQSQTRRITGRKSGAYPVHAPLSSSPQDGGSENHLDAATDAQTVRLRSPEDLGLDSWGKSFSGSPEQAQLFLDLHRSDPEAAHRIAQAVTAMPEVGTEFLGFRLRAELGEGAFAKVFLAQQGDLANRSVVLKVSPTSDDESQALAQLQHTNIVPIYSVHRAGSLQAVCMPYFGATTLANVLKDMEGRELPRSGKDLVSTIVACKSTLREANGEGQVAKDQEGEARGVGRETIPEEQRVESSLAPRPAPLAPHLEVLQALSHVEAAVWIGGRLADGLGHAHDRGILHRDLKPANILLTDDGQPMLLDFNLAQDTKPDGCTTLLQVGGTLPFMPPEQIEAFRSQALHLDTRSDIYSLGVILYGLLTGRHPFPSRTGPVKEVMAKMIADRLAPPPSVRCWNNAVSPAVESMIHHCLQPDPKRRYQTARELKEDLDRHLENLPLRYAPEPSLRERARKWQRRHPRLASLTTVAVLAGIAIAGLASIVLIRGQRLAEVEARESLRSFLKEEKTVQYLLTARTNDTAELDKGIALGRDLLSSYDVLDNPEWQKQPAVRNLSAPDQAALRRNAAELLMFLARGMSLQALSQTGLAQKELIARALELNHQAETCCDQMASSRALWAQRAELTAQLGRNREAKELEAKAGALPLVTSADHYLVAVEHVAKGRIQQALPLLKKAAEQDPQDFWAWFLRGVCHDQLAQSAESIASYSTCIALTPTSSWSYLSRGLAQLRRQNYLEAASDLDRAIQLRPNLVEAYRNRALARQGLKRYAEAVEDLTRALELGAAPAHVYFLRAALREQTGDATGAKQDRELGLRNPPSDELGWLSRGYARLNADPKGALADFDQALKLNPRSLAGLQNKAHILSKMDRNEEAVKALNLLVDVYPDFLLARSGRSVLLARLGKRTEAHRDADHCLARDHQALTLYQLAGVYALTSKTTPADRRQAFRLLSAALQKGFGFDLLETDRDLDPIRRCPEFQRLVSAARAIRTTMAAKSTAP